MDTELRRLSGGLACLLGAMVLAGLTVVPTAAQSSRGGAGGERVAQVAPLQVTLSTDRNSYKVGDEVSIQVLLTNRSKSAFYVYDHLDWGESASLSIWLKDQDSGEHVTGDFLADAITPPPSSEDQFVKVLPDHVYGVVVRTTIAELNLRKTGTYELTAEYHSPIPAKFSFGLPVWSRESGRVPSNRVTITVGK